MVGSIAYVLLGSLTDIVIILLFLWGIMNIPLVNNKRTIVLTGIITVFLLLVAGFYKNINSDGAMICATCIVIIAVCFLFQGNVFKLIAYSLLTYVVAMFLDSCLLGVYSIFNINTDSAYMRVVDGILINMIIGIIILIKRRKRLFLQIKLSKKIYALLFVGAGTGLMIMAGLMVESNNRVSESARRAVIIVTIIVVISYCAACIMMVFITDSRDSYKALSQINQKVIEAQQQYYVLVNEKQHEIRSIRHEMKNHLACIHGLYQAGKLSEMEHYISQLIETPETSADLFDTGNDIVNAILNEMHSRYRNENIAIRLEGGFPSDLLIAPMDLCVIFANILSNAIEAIQRIESNKEAFSYVDVKISSFKNDLYISVKNPVARNVSVNDGILVTSKKNKSLHGFGINNVIKRVEKYQGSYQYHIDNGSFYVEIHMKNN